MKIVLVHPTGSNWIPGKRDITATANRMAPLGLLSIAAYLEQKGHRVAVHDCLGPGATADNNRTVAEILDHHPDLVGLSATTSGFLDGCDLARRMKSVRPDIQTVFGGVHISALGSPLLEDFPEIDYLVMGEGEVTLAQLAAGEDPAAIHGLVWRNGSLPVTNPAREPIGDLDRLPFPAYEKLKGFPEGYNLPLFSYIHTPGATMVTSRGCPYQCSYCDRSVFKRSYRTQSPGYVHEHLGYLAGRFHVRHVNIYDDLFTADRDRITRLCDLLITKPTGVQFNCAVRVGHADNDLLEMLKAAGALQVSVGIESGSQALLSAHKPGLYLEEVEDTVRRIQAKGLRAKGLFMMGLPGETVASIEKTSHFALSLDLDDMNMSKFTPFPGAPIWRGIEEKGTLDVDWRKMNCLNFVFLPREIDSIGTLDELYNRHVKRFYSCRNWRKKFQRRLWQHRHSIWYMLKHLPTFLAARRTFEPTGNRHFQDADAFRTT
jgi:magnesium-protoporphyrin IX monomethyl ester (oxidative) cyclase